MKHLPKPQSLKMRFWRWFTYYRKDQLDLSPIEISVLVVTFLLLQFGLIAFLPTLGLLNIN